MLWAFPVLKICRPRSSRSEPSRIHVAERHTKTIHSSLFSLHSPSPGLPVPLPGKAREPPSAGAEDQFPGSNTGLQNALSLRTAPPAGHRLVLNPCRRAAHRNSSLFSILSSLAQPRPSPPTPREGQRTALRRGGESVPRRQCGTAKRPSPRTAPHAGHRLILNPCRRAAHQNSSLFSILYSLSQPCPFSLRSGQQNKNIFCFLVT